MRYSSKVSVLPTVEGGGRAPSLEKQTAVHAKQCTAVNRASSKAYFSRLKKGPPKKLDISLTLLYISSQLPYSYA